MIPSSMRKLLAFGNGVGIEIAGARGAETLRIAAVRVRPNGARAVDGFSIENAAQRPAAEWGREYAAFLKKIDWKYAVATVLLPREDVILRQIAVPGVSDKDLPAAVGYQLDGLHPYAEDDVASSWARLPGTSTVLVAIVRRAAIEKYQAWFAEAGVKVASFTCAPAAIYSARRLFRSDPEPALALAEVNGRMEMYGESPAKPLFSATFDAAPERATALALAELRLDPLTETRSFHALLGADPALPYAAALIAACPFLSLPLNLLPKDQRASNARALWIPTAVAAGVLLTVGAALAAYPAIEDRRYLHSLNQQIAEVRPRAAQAVKLEKDTASARQKAILLDRFRSQSKLDIDALREMTHILPPPIWLNTLELTRTQIVVAGEAEQAAPLLKQIDASPYFEASEFAMQPQRIQTGEAFRVRSQREAGK
jgi:Tfp pilus assembly protein PilN